MVLLWRKKQDARQKPPTLRNFLNYVHAKSSDDSQTQTYVKVRLALKTSRHAIRRCISKVSVYRGFLLQSLILKTYFLEN